MRRRGVSLAEVMVAAAVLGIGVAGCLATLASAVRLRAVAATREAMALAADSRLSWFEARACASTDTTIDVAAGGTAQHWEVRRDPTGATIAGSLRAHHAGHEFGIQVMAGLACD